MSRARTVCLRGLALVIAMLVGISSASAAPKRSKPEHPPGHGMVVAGVTLIVASAAAYVAMAVGLGVGNDAEERLPSLRGRDDIDERRDVIARGQLGNRLAIGAGVTAATLMVTGVPLAIVGRNRAIRYYEKRTPGRQFHARASQYQRRPTPALLRWLLARGRLVLDVELTAAGPKLLGFLLHRTLELGFVEVANVLRQLHRAEVRPAHRAEVRGLGRSRRQGFVVELAGRCGVEGEVELVVPPKLEPRLGQGVVASLGTGMPLGQVGRMRGDLVRDDPVLDVVAVGEPEVLLGGHVAKHRAAELPDHRRPDRRGDVVVARGDVRGQGPSV